MPLPDFLKDRYKDWNKNDFPRTQKLYKNLKDNGQNPKSVVISCCDSRVHVNNIFKSQIGEFFIHRNIANLVPLTDSTDLNVGTISTIEYGIETLDIPNIIILGHSNCGGIKYAYEKFLSENKHQETFIDKWIETIRPAYQILDKKQSYENQIISLEKLSIINSIKNLVQYSKINKLILEKKIKIHGLWFEIGKGNLMDYNFNNNKFESII